MWQILSKLVKNVKENGKIVDRTDSVCESSTV